MKLFTQLQTVKVPADVVKKAKSFADRVAATTDYSDNNQYNKTKISRFGIWLILDIPVFSYQDRSHITETRSLGMFCGIQRPTRL